jgi:predicted  nucleic acid-binding Zn-ribbon protein
MASYDSERVFAERLANVFLQDHKVKVGEGNGVIACCDVMKKQIWFDFPEIFPKNFDDEQEKIFQQMMVFKGLSFHEILHLKFTPKIQRRITNQIFMRLLGQLEDGRIETLGVMLHEKLADYFICSVDEIIIKDRNAIIENKDNWLIFAYILCYGRSIYFQDKDLLAMMREMIIKTYGRETAEIIEDTINAFLPEISFEKRVEIAQKLFDHLNGKGIMPKFDMSKPMDVFIITGRGDENDRNMDKDLKELSQDFPELAKALDGVAKQLKEMTKDVKDDSDGMEKAKQEKEDKIADIMKKRQEVYKKVYDEKDADKRNKLRQEVDELTDELKETQSSTGFSPDGLGDVKEKLKQKIDDKEEEQEKLVETHRDDLTADLKSIGHELQDVYADNTFTVTQEMRTIAKDLEKNLVKMNNELASGYQPKNKSGRLNVRSLLNRKNQMDFKIFNRYTPDKLRLTKALVNIYVDGSGSMSMEWDKAVSCMWVINEALNRDENKIMIYQFSSGYELIKEYDKPLTVPNMIGGGTYPAGAIEHSIKIIEGYKKAKNFNFVVDIIITDGEFEDSQDTSIMKLNNLGHETILIKVGAYAGNPELTHKSKHTLGLTGFGELVGSLTKIFIEIKKGLVAKTRMI